MRFIKGFQALLDSFATVGGNILLLFWCSVLTGGLWAYVTRYGDPNLQTPVFGVFTGFTGALLQSLRGDSVRHQIPPGEEQSPPVVPPKEP